MVDATSVNQYADIGSAIMKILAPVIVALAGMATASLGLAMAKFKDWLVAQTHNTTVAGAMKILTDIVTTIVQDLEQTSVKTLRDNDGKLDAKTAGQIKASAIERIKLLYGPIGLRDLSRRLGTSEDATLRLIGALIESAVYLLRNPPPAPALLGSGDTFDPNVFGGMTDSERAAAHAASAPLSPSPT
jgi:hypothetical protein